MKSSLVTLKTRLNEIKAELIALINTLPDCLDGVTMLGPGCGVVNLSTIAQNKGILSPRYYLVSGVKDDLKTLIEKGSIDSLLNKIEGILKTGQIDIAGSRSRLAPEFVEKLRKLWES